MKNLNVKWVPETFAIVSLTIATSQHATAESHSHLEELTKLPHVAGTKHIVISGGKELKAYVRTAAL